MKNNNKALFTVIFSALAGSLVGGIVAIYFASQFFSETTILASSNQLNSNIWALEHIQRGDTKKVIELLEQDAKINIVTVSGYDQNVTSETSAAVATSISNAKKYFDKYPVTFINEDEKSLIEDTFKKAVEN